MSAVVQFRAKDQNAAAATSALWTAAIEACPEGLAVIENGRVLGANHAFAQILGYFHSSEIDGYALAKFLEASEFLPLPGQEVSNPVSSRSTSVGYCNAIRKDGAHVRVRISQAFFRVDQSDLQVISARMLGEAASDEEYLPDAQKQKMEALGRLVGGVAHDFNNLLTGILLYCDLLAARLESNGPLQAYIEEIRKAGTQSAALIQQLLMVARPQPVGVWEASWNEAVSSLRDLLQRLLGENIELIAELADAAMPVKMDPVQMRQIVLNLVLNARDAMPGGGRITLTTRNRAASTACSENPGSCVVEFVVTDTGCGMDTETRSHLFETFFTTKPPGQGNGLGLATVHRIVHEAGGAIQVESELGKGTRITISLPGRDPQAAAQNVVAERNPSPRQNPRDRERVSESE